MSMSVRTLSDPIRVFLSLSLWTRIVSLDEVVDAEAADAPGSGVSEAGTDTG